MIDLRDLLKHEIMDLYSAEEQIIEAMPSMIDKANNGKLKTALKEHLRITEKQKARLEEIQKLMGETGGEANAEIDAGTESNPGFFSRLFGGGGAEKCKGMEGLISEGEKMMGEDMSPEVLDAAIIAGAQKIEHYEICGYGTARAFARELNLGEVANKLQETLNEEYYADDLLTELAVGKLNVEAEFAEEPENKGRRLRTEQTSSKAKSNGRGTPAKSNRGSIAKATSGGNSKSGSGKSKASPSKSSSSSSKSSSSKSSAPAKSSASRSSGKTSASGGGSKSSKSTSQAKTSNNSRGSSKKSASKSSSGNRSKSSRSKGGRR